MTTHTINNQRLLLSQASKTPITTFRPPKNSKTNILPTAGPSSRLPPPPSSSSSSRRPPPTSSSSAAAARVSRNPWTNNIIASTEITPKSRILVVRSASRGADDSIEPNEVKEAEKTNPVQLPAVLTNGRTSVYLIRRPIPSVEPTSIQTKLYQEQNEEPPTTPTTTNDVQDVDTLSPTEDTVTSPTQVESSLIRPKTSKHRTPFTRSESPEENSPVNIHNESSTIHSPDSSKHLITSPTQSGNSEQIKPRSRSKSVRRILVHSRSRSRSARRQRRRSPTERSPSPSPPIQQESKQTDKRRNFFSFSRTKSTAVQADLPSSETIEKEQRIIRNIRPTVTRNSQRIKSSKSIVLVNPDDQTIAVVENPYVKGDSITPILKRPVSVKNARFLNDGQSIGESNKRSRLNSCLNCLSRRKCLIIIICIILAIIGLVGVGVSAYFLATDSKTNLIPKIVGIAVGGLIAIIALTFLYCILACIDSRDDYFSYDDDVPYTGSKVFTVIPSSHPNTHLRSNIQQSTINRQKPITTDINSTNNGKNLIIQMPERLLTARKLSPKSQERKINNVVNNIGRIVQDAKKRYNGDVPNKVIVKVDENVKPST
ncbi:unnamed protein product [Rotaria sp. Silwood1]|nr:unnamed protein product [Rotaria sp. Silwood1]CAF3680088.1 unnamed protein product [Rotaria sp. Silwood1]CAF4670353.1 unnamed protein product [Rotaria sp. Silwood1]CAF4800759.1 unnamed protein product [Rotaria sp. Silwood1]